MVAGFDDGGAIELLQDGGAIEYRVERELVARIDRCHLPAFDEPHAPFAHLRALERRRTLRVRKKFQRHMRTHADYCRVEIDEDRRDLGQLDAETAEIGGGEDLAQDG